MNGSLYINDRLIAEVDLPRHDKELRHRVAPIYGCPKCGEIWARFVPRPDTPALYMFYTKPCIVHGDGSLRLYGDYPLTTLPFEALVRELDLIIHNEETNQCKNSLPMA